MTVDLSVNRRRVKLVDLSVSMEPHGGMVSRLKGLWFVCGYTCGYNLFSAGMSTSVLVVV